MPIMTAENAGAAPACVIGTIPMQQLDLVPVVLETTPENAKRLIKRWNAAFDFDVEGLDALSPDALMAELAMECAIFRSDKKRAPIVHTSDNNVIYRPRHPFVIILAGNEQKYMPAPLFWAMEKDLRERGTPFSTPVLIAVGKGGYILCKKL